MSFKLWVLRFEAWASEWLWPGLATSKDKLALMLWMLWQAYWRLL